MAALIVDPSQLIPFDQAAAVVVGPCGHVVEASTVDVEAPLRNPPEGHTAGILRRRQVGFCWCDCDDVGGR